MAIISEDNRFTLEDDMTKAFIVTEEIDTLIYKIGDCSTPATEDEVLNILIGIKELCNVRHERLWNTFERLIAKKVIL
tara:strand:+ start:3131 stop:3364 length:234 start_codon:yes stop_codon:yes gene_type:complete